MNLLKLQTSGTGTLCSMKQKFSLVGGRGFSKDGLSFSKSNNSTMKPLKSAPISDSVIANNARDEDFHSDTDRLYSTARFNVCASMAILMSVDSDLTRAITSGGGRGKSNLEICNDVLDKIVLYSESFTRVLKMTISDLETVMVGLECSNSHGGQLFLSKHEIKRSVISLENAAYSFSIWKAEAEVCRTEISTDLNLCSQRSGLTHLEEVLKILQFKLDPECVIQELDIALMILSRAGLHMCGGDTDD